MEYEALEARVRRRARAAGYIVRKSRVRAIHLDDFGEYMLIDADGNYVVLGGKFDATLDDIEDFLAPNK